MARYEQLVDLCDGIEAFSRLIEIPAPQVLGELQRKASMRGPYVRTIDLSRSPLKTRPDGPPAGTDGSDERTTIARLFQRLLV